MNPTQFLEAVRAHAWPIVAAVVIGALVRAVKSDRIPVNVPSRFRPLLALGLGLASGSCDAIVRGTAWQEALGLGLLSSFIAMGGHDVLIESLRGGREVSGPPAGGAAALVVTVVAGLALTGCGASMLSTSSTVANAGAEAAEAAKPLLVERCIEPMQEALKHADVALARATADRCDPAVAAFDLLRSTHVALRAGIVAIASGRMPTNVLELVAGVVESSQALASAIGSLR